MQNFSFSSILRKNWFALKWVFKSATFRGFSFNGGHINSYCFISIFSSFLVKNLIVCPVYNPEI